MKTFFKALKLLGVTAAILIAVLAVFLFVFSRDIAPTDVSELILPGLSEVAAENNAFTYFMQAEALIPKPYEPEVLTQFISGNQCDTNELIKVLAANEPMLAEIKEGLSKKVCLIPEISRRVCSFPHISEWMHIRMVLLARSKYQLVAGQHSDALDTCLTNLKFVSFLQRSINDETLLIVCNNITRSALLQSAHIARSGSLSGEQLAGLSEALKGIDETGQDWVRALKHAYCRDVAFFSGGFLADYFRRVCGYKSERFSRFKLQPNMVKELLAIPSREMIRNVQTDYSQVKFSSSEEWLNSAKYNAWNLSAKIVDKSEWLKHAQKAWMCELEDLAEFRCCLSAARLIVALNLYEKRNGRLPDNLEQLVPAYIGNIPRDPYDGKPFRYNQAKEIVYSVGRNLKDEGGSIEQGYRGNKLQASARFKGEDYIFGIKKKQFFLPLRH